MNMNSKDRLLKISLLSLVILPSSLQYSQYIYLNGVYWFDVISVCLLALFLISTLFGFKFMLSNKVKLFVIPALIIVLYALFKLPFETVNFEKFKDFRPVLYILFVFLMVQLSRNIYLNEKDIFRLVILCFFSSMAFALTSYLGLSKSQDVFYKPEFRYLGIQTYFCLAFLIYSFTSKKIHFAYVFIAYLVIIISLSRMLFLISLIPLGIWLFSRGRYLSKVIFAFIGLPLIGYLLVGTELISKFELAFEFGMSGFFDNRYGPALEVIRKMDSAQIIFGSGFGKLFHIPWFEYRENLNPYSVQIDNLYLTFFAKYGLLTSIIIPCLLSLFISGNKKRQWLCMISLVVIFFTSSVFYHIASIGFYTFYTLRVKENEC